jgi:hypothetical protein
MFCPQCKAEYRPGFTRCSDCEMDLVERLSESDRSVDTELPDASLKSVWFCDDRESCLYVCAGLKAAGIPFNVTQRKHQVFWNMDEHYEVFVPPDFYEKAKTIAEQGCVDFSDTPEDQKIMELPDVGRGLAKHANRNRSWRPEDAIVEVWSEKVEERAWFEQVKGLAWMIELSLCENGIGTRIGVSQDGFRRIFVRPEDGFQAREVVREIESSAPPT